MAEFHPELSSSDDALQNGASSINPPDQIRAAIRKMEALDAKFDALAKPPIFRTADVANLAAIFFALLIAILTAFGLNNRIDDLKMRHSDAERRIDSHIEAVEQRLGSKIDKLGDKFGDADERLSRIEGRNHN